MFTNRRFNIALISALIIPSVAARNGPTWSEGRMRPGDGAGDGKVLKDIPQYVLDYAPLVHLHSKEYFWPSDMSEHLEHVEIYVNETKVAGQSTVDDLAELNQLGGANGRWVYLASKDYIDMWKDANIKDLPAWLTGEHNIPIAPAYGVEEQLAAGLGDLPLWDEDFHIWHTVGPKDAASSPEELPQTKDERRSSEHIIARSVGGRSSAPAVLIVVEKGDGVVDAFWFFFYSYNLGNSVFNFRFGNHVGDWEHATMRFYNGVPKVMFLSEHEGGKGFTYHAAEKYGKRPVIYSASGTHAMYPTPGIQDYVLPFRLLRDQTDKGPLWDPVLNIYAYHYDSLAANGTDRSIRSVRSPFSPSPPSSSFSSAASSDVHPPLTDDDDPPLLTPSTLTPHAPISWFSYGGHWGNRFYPRHDHRQYALGPEKAYVSGPFGPRFKALGRRTVCPYDGCVIRDSVAPRTWALRIFIDYLFAVAIVWLIASVVIGVLWCVRVVMRRGVGREQREQREQEPDPEGEVTERTGLLARDGVVRGVAGARRERGR